MYEIFCSIAGMKKKSIDDGELKIPGSEDEMEHLDQRVTEHPDHLGDFGIDY